MADPVDLDNVLSDIKTELDDHRRLYVETCGRIGHVWDTRKWGGRRNSALVLGVIGRKTGLQRLVTLLYAPWGHEYVIVASKAGAPEQPAWFLNLIARPDFSFQIGCKRWRGSWRLVGDREKDELWDYLDEQYPPYRDYRAHTSRDIPLILLSPGEEIAPFCPSDL